MLSSSSNWNVLVKFQWLLKGGDLTQLNCHSLCLLALGPTAVIPWFALGELRSLCASSPWLVLGSGLGPWSGIGQGLGIWQGPMEWKCKRKMTVVESRLAFSHLPSVLGRALLGTDFFFPFFIFICSWCTQMLAGIDFQPLVLLMFHCIDIWKDCPNMLWKPLSICFFFPEHRSWTP